MSNIIHKNKVRKFQQLLAFLDDYVTHKEVAKLINRHYNTVLNHRRKENPDPILIEAIVRASIKIYRDKCHKINEEIKGLGL